MKKTLLLGLMVILFVACQEAKPERFTSDSPEINVTKSLIKDYEDGNWESWITHYADTAKIHHNTVESISPTELRDGFKQNLVNVSSYGFSEEDTVLEMVLDAEDETWVYCWANWKGTYKGSDKELVIPVHLALRFLDGKIVSEYAYYDNAPQVAILTELAKEAAESMAEEE